MDQNLQQLAQLLGQNFNQEELDSLLGNVKGFKERDYSKYKDKPLLYIREVLGGNVWKGQADILQSYVDNQITIATSAHSLGKCLHKFNKNIYLWTGEQVAGVDLIGKKFTIPSFNEETFELEPAEAYAVDNGVKPVYEITTMSGRKIVRTENHPLYTWHGWKNVEDLKVGENLFVPKELKLGNNKETIPDDEIKFLGFMLGDGSTSANYVGFTQANNKQLCEMRDIVTSWGLLFNKYQEFHYSVVRKPEKRKRSDKNKAKELLKHHGIMGKNSWTKKVPDEIFTQTNEKIALFLNRYYSTDGWAYTNDKDKVEIGVCTVSSELASDVHHLLLRFGIVSTLRKKKTTCNDVKNWAWCVDINKPDDCFKFIENIGIYGKEEALEKVKVVCEKKLNSGFKQAREPEIDYQSPDIWYDLYDIAKRNGTSLYKIGLKQHANRRLRKHSRKNITKVYEATGDESLRKKLSSWIGWDEIKSIEYLGEEPTVSITVPGNETFVTNFIEHNTYILGAIVNYAFDVYQPGTLVSTAPSQAALEDVLWNEIRLQRKHERHYFKPAAPVLHRREDSRASGFTAAKGEAMHGRHLGKQTLILEEAAGIEMKIFKAAKSMLTKPEDRMILTLNPLDISCAAYQFQMQHPQAKVIQLNMVQHPNIKHELRNEDPPIPHAARLSMLMGYLNTEADIIRDKDAFRKDVDLVWPDDEYKVYKKYGLETSNFSGLFDDCGDYVILKPTMYRVTPEIEGRVLGRWPSDSVSAVWSQVTIKRCETEQQPLPLAGDRKWGPPVIGTDPALMGNDYSVFMVRWGPCIVECLAYQSTEPEFLNSKMKKLVDKWAKEAGCERSDIKCYFDSGGGYGSALMMFKEGYNFIPINGAEKAMNDYVYENRRAELWFNASERGKKELVEWTRLTRDQRQIISSDLLACQYKITGSKARRQLMRKDEMRRSIGRSPDYGDALALVCIDYYKEPEIEPKKNYSFREKEDFSTPFKSTNGFSGGISRNWMG